jgi:hypothetical protein
MLLLLLMMMTTTMTTMTMDDDGDYADDFLLLVLGVAVLTWEATKMNTKSEKALLNCCRGCCDTARACEMSHQQQNHTLAVYACVSYGFGAAAGGLWVSPITTC